MRYIWFGILCVSVLLSASAVVAQVVVPESYYLTDMGEAAVETDAEAAFVAGCHAAWGSSLTQSGDFVGRSSPEVAEVVAGCLADTASPTFSRTCDLAVASRTIDLIVVLGVYGEGETLAGGVQVLSPLLDALVWSDIAWSEHADPFAAGLDACATMADRFVAGRGGVADPAIVSPAPVSTTGPEAGADPSLASATTAPQAPGALSSDAPDLASDVDKTSVAVVTPNVMASTIVRHMTGVARSTAFDVMAAETRRDPHGLAAYDEATTSGASAAGALLLIGLTAFGVAGVMAFDMASSTGDPALATDDGGSAAAARGAIGVTLGIGTVATLLGASVLSSRSQAGPSVSVGPHGDGARLRLGWRW